MGLIVDRVVAPYFATNCWIIAPGVGSPALVVDPGIDIPHMAAAISSKLREYKLTMGAVLITPGHLDHTFSLMPVIEECGTAITYVHSFDRDLLKNPEGAMGEHGLGLLNQLRSQMQHLRFEEPTDVREIESDCRLNCGEMELVLTHTPGHTPGSIIATINDEVVVTGDTLFAGSIGRTDLPRGSMTEMQRTLREKIALLEPGLEVLPGHGERSRMEYELKNNPYLRAAFVGELA